MGNICWPYVIHIPTCIRELSSKVDRNFFIWFQKIVGLNKVCILLFCLNFPDFWKSSPKYKIRPMNLSTSWINTLNNLQISSSLKQYNACKIRIRPQNISFLSYLQHTLPMFWLPLVPFILHVFVVLHFHNAQCLSNIWFPLENPTNYANLRSVFVVVWMRCQSWKVFTTKLKIQSRLLKTRHTFLLKFLFLINFCPHSS